MKFPIISVALALTISAAVAQEQQQTQQVQKTAPQLANPRMDFSANLRISEETEQLRERRRVTEDQFLDLAAEPGSVILDARSADKYRMRHVKGAVNLPFTDFTEQSLAKVIPTKDTRVLIYCNNNFRGDNVAFAEKRAAAALNISTFTNLRIYGYTNVYELAPLVDVHSTKLTLEGHRSGE